MTGTTAMNPSLGARGVNSVVRMAATVALVVLLVVGAFAFGRGTADTHGGLPRVISTSSSATQPASCGSAFHTPPC